ADGDVGGRVRNAFDRGMARLKAATGSDQPSRWRWGRLHTVTFNHPLGERCEAPRFDTGPSPTSGGATVRAAGFGEGNFDPDGHFRVVSGSTYRFVAELGPGGGTRSVQNLGQSAHPS